MEQHPIINRDNHTNTHFMNENEILFVSLFSLYSELWKYNIPDNQWIKWFTFEQWDIVIQQYRYTFIVLDMSLLLI